MQALQQDVAYLASFLKDHHDDDSTYACRS